MTIASLHKLPIQTKLAAAAAVCALLGAAGLLSGSPASASAGLPATSATVQAALRHDLSHYLTTRRRPSTSPRSRCG